MKKIKKLLTNQIVWFVILTNDFLFIILAIILYYLFPILLNYPDGLIDSGYPEKWGYHYSKWYILNVCLIIIFLSLFLWIKLRKLKGWYLLSLKDLKKSKIRKMCINLPYFIYIALLLLPMVSMLIIPSITYIIYQINTNLTTIVNIKQITSLFSVLTMLAIISFIITKHIFKTILIKTYSDDKLEGMRINLNTKIFLQLIPLVIIAIFFTALMGYSQLINEKGNLLFKIHHTELLKNTSDIPFITSLDSVKAKMKKLDLDHDISYFIISPDNEIITSDNQELDFWFFNYLKDISPSQNGRIYSNTKEIQGVMLTIPGIDGNWIIGLKYYVTSLTITKYFLITFCILMIFNIGVIFIFTKSLTSDITHVTDGLTAISQNDKLDLDQKIPVTSNDEIGDLIYAFNRIQDTVKNNVREIERHHIQKNNFLTNIVHEIFTPLTIIQNAISIYQKKNDHTYLVTAGNKIKELAKDLKDVLTMQKLEVGYNMFSIGMKSINLSEILKKEIHEFQTVLNAEKLSVRTGIENNLYIKANQFSMKTVINNLLTNARKNISGAGVIEARLMKQKGKIILSIRDNGKGIPHDELKNIFRAYYQLDKEDKRIPGFGLGLHIVKQAVDAMQSAIEVKSETGKGTIFTVIFPEHKPGDSDETVEKYIPSQYYAESGFSREQAEINKKKKTILVVDDNEDILRLIKISLEEKYNILFALNGLEALGEVKRNENSIDLILLDIMMDRMDGYEFIEELTRQQCEIPVYFLTAKIDLQDRTRGLDYSQVLDYINKPFAIEELEKKIANLFVFIKKCKSEYQPRIQVILNKEKPVKGKDKFKTFAVNYEYTKRESEVVRECLKGLKRKTIAYNLKISETTVRDHISSILKKSGVNSRLELYSLFMKFCEEN